MLSSIPLSPKEGKKEGRTKLVRMDLEKVVEKNNQNTAQKLA
jgi:hypothetical protein